MGFLDETIINKYIIELVIEKKLPYRPIYSLNPIKLETLKTYINTHFQTGFLQPSKSPTDALILFNKKLDSSLHLCMNYCGLNNLTIKKQYLLTLMSKSLDQLGLAKKFT